jgi:uncharacterized protein Yka (UPF0111/DUF47 family)
MVSSSAFRLPIMTDMQVGDAKSRQDTFAQSENVEELQKLFERLRSDDFSDVEEYTKTEDGEKENFQING